MSECSHDCSTCGENCASRDKQSFLEPANQFSNIGKVYAVVSGKGGVGKSLVTGLLAVLAKRAGYDVAVLDADITGPSVPRMFGLKQQALGNDAGIIPVMTKTGIEVMSINLLLEEDTSPVVWRGPVIAGTVKQFWTDVVWNKVDYMFVDMPPGTGDVPLTVFQSLPVDGVIVVTSPQELVGMVVEKAVNMASLMEKPVMALVENMSYMVCPDCQKKVYPFGESKLEQTAKRLNIPMTARIPINPKLAAACDKGLIELFDGDWLDEISKELLK
ncbi:MAG: Mrp/NBP35 family ATP-binding protein [Clostridia bacterium]|nr:Mrp/NBP35 family ATP-binding protein [Clostridia bacterium]